MLAGVGSSVGLDNLRGITRTLTRLRVIASRVAVQLPAAHRRELAVGESNSETGKRVRERKKTNPDVFDVVEFAVDETNPPIAI